VIPSRDEGFGIAALEAMARARPVLGFSVGGLPEVVLDGVTGALVPPEDQDALVRRLAEFSNDRVALAALGQEGWRRANTDFSVETMAQHTAELYDRLLNRIAS
jgi:glycosyltransferase involved in cell wall biosynthesis